VQSLPVASHAPARAEPRHEDVPPLRLYAEGDVIADGAPIAIREDEKKNDRCHDDPQNEEGNQDDGKDHGATSGVRLDDYCTEIRD